MKKKMILIPILVLLMLFAVAPAMATPTNGQKVTASIASVRASYFGAPYPAPITSERYYEPGHILNPTTPPAGYETFQSHASSYQSITMLRIGDNDPVTGFSCNEQQAEYNAKTHSIQIQYIAIWFIGSKGDLSSGFAGNIETKAFNYVSPTYDRITIHCVMKGFGSYEGQTIMLSYDGANSAEPWTGYCLKG